MAQPLLPSRRAVLVTVAAVGAGLAAASQATARAQTHTIIMDKMKFGPAPGEVRVGDTIEWVNRDMFQHTATARNGAEWVNRDMFQHTATARNGAFDVDLPPGATDRTVLHAAGTVEFYCRYHPTMVGRLVIR